MPQNFDGIPNKIPPQNLEVEQSLLGAILIDKNAIIKIGDIISPQDFYKDSHALIYETMVDLYQNHEPIDLLSLCNKLQEKKLLESVGGRTYISSLASAVPTSSHVITYAKILQKKATLRRLISAASDIGELSFQEVEDTEMLLDKAEQMLFQVSQKYLKKNFIPIKEKVPVAIFSLEMSKEQLVDRMLCAEAGVDLWKMRTGKLSTHGENDDFARIGHAIGILSE